VVNCPNYEKFEAKASPFTVVAESNLAPY